jgi:murein DD-endopeptidase MepM/ murein hydrolase activator NlpD
MALATCLSLAGPAPGLEIEVNEKPVVVVPVVERRLELGWPMHPEDFIALSSPYGKRDLNESGGYGSGDHRGVDMYGTWRARVVSVAEGVVIDHWPPPDKRFRGHPVLGGLLVIRHSGTVSLYGHLAKTYVKEGDVVCRGQVIGRQGSTGKTASAHLHFELSVDGVLVNPLKYIFE